MGMSAGADGVSQRMIGDGPYWLAIDDDRFGMMKLAGLAIGAQDTICLGVTKFPVSRLQRGIDGSQRLTVKRMVIIRELILMALVTSLGADVARGRQCLLKARRFHWRQRRQDGDFGRRLCRRRGGGVASIDAFAGRRVRLRATRRRLIGTPAYGAGERSRDKAAARKVR